MDNLPTIQSYSVIEVRDQTTLEQATELLSTLNKDLDIITAHKEAKTKPINEALKKIRQDYKPLTEKLEEAISTIRQSITTYVTNQQRIAKEQEAKILADKRTNVDTKINKLATIDNTATDKVSTDAGSISFITVKKYTINKLITKEEIELLISVGAIVLDSTALKAYLKAGNDLPKGITETEEQSLRNYR